MVHGDGEIYQIAAERAKPRKRPLLVGTGKLGVTGSDMDDFQHESD
jgi:hypothetical protein